MIFCVVFCYDFGIIFCSGCGLIFEDCQVVCLYAIKAISVEENGINYFVGEDVTAHLSLL